MKSIKIIKIIAIILLISSYSCEEEKEAIIIPETKTNMPIERGDYDNTGYEYPESGIEKWQPNSPKSIVITKKQPDFETKVDSLKNFELQNSTTIHQGFINRKEGTHIYSKQSFDSKVVSTLPQGALVHIIEIGKAFKQYTTQKDKPLNGKWTKVEYQSLDYNIVSGYILDEFINYHIDTKPLATVNDTVTVKNEAEFLKALSSNRLIEVATDTLDFETYFKSIEQEETTTQEDIEYMDYETYYTTSYGYEEELLALGLYGYHDLIIRGKNRTVAFVVTDESSDVLTINNCQNIVLENLNFYHDVSTSCEGEVVVIFDSNNLLFNNIYFNGSGNIGAYIKNSNQIDFKNSHFFNNSSYGIYSVSSKNITVQNTAFYDNGLSSIINSKTDDEQEEEYEDGYYNTVITLNQVTITNNYIYNTIFNLDDAKLDCFECIIENNETSSLLNSEYNTNFNFTNSRFTKNQGQHGDYIIQNNGSEISIKNSAIEKNDNYYEFINNGANYQEDDLTTISNTFNQKLDSIPNSKNSTIINHKAYMHRDNKSLSKNQNNQLSTPLGYTLNGFQAIQFETPYYKKTEFLGLDLSFINNVYHIFKYAYGACKQGKLEGPWRFTTNTNEDFIMDVTYVNGNANGEAKVYGFGNNLIIEGHYINNKKTGTWNFYNQEGIITKTLDYENDIEKGPFIVYYPNGNKREMKSHKDVDKGVILSYYPNGERLCDIVFNDDASINLEKTKFFNNKGKVLDIIKSKAIVNSNKTDVESNLSKDNLRNKVVILESGEHTNGPNYNDQFLGFYQTNDKGEKHGFSKLFDITLSKDENQSLKRKPNASAMFTEYNNNTRLKFDLYTENASRVLSSTTNEQGTMTMCSYNGWFEALSNVGSIDIDSKGKMTKTGLHQQYHNHGALKEEGLYNNNEKVEGTWKTYNSN